MSATLAYGYSSERTQHESYPMNTNMTGFRSLGPCALDKSNLSIGRVNPKNIFKSVIGSFNTFQGMNRLKSLVPSCQTICTPGVCQSVKTYSEIPFPC